MSTKAELEEWNARYLVGENMRDTLSKDELVELADYQYAKAEEESAYCKRALIEGSVRSKDSLIYRGAFDAMVRHCGKSSSADTVARAAVELHRKWLDEAIEEELAKDGAA